MNQYLVPANSKKSRLILGFFTPRDLIVCGIGGGISIIALLVVNNPSMLELILLIIPLLFAVLMVFPVPYYHNVMQLIINIFNYFTKRNKYYWKGWCVKYDTEE